MNFAYFFLLAVLMLFFVLGFVTYVILAERKVMGFIQLRKGPNQVGGSWGLLQTVADVLKLLIKEDIIPKLADRPLYKLAPIIAFAPSFMVIAVIPFTDKFQFADIGVGLLYYIAISGLTTIGIVTAGWASNNKYALLGAMRGAAQMISYEIPLGDVCSRNYFINRKLELERHCRRTGKGLVYCASASSVYRLLYRSNR